MRLQLATFGIKVMQEKPITGIGYKQFNNYFQENHSRFGLDSINKSLTDHAHNTFIEIGATAGIPALVLVFLFFFYWIRMNFRYKENRIIFIPVIISILLVD